MRLDEGLLDVLEVKLRKEEMQQVGINFLLALEDVFAEEVELQWQSHDVVAKGLRGAVVQLSLKLLVDDGEFLGYFVHLINC